MGVKVYLCEKIEHASSHNTELDSSVNVVLKTGFSWLTIEATNAQFTINTKENDAGLYAEETLEFVSDMTGVQSRLLLYYTQIFRLRFSDGTTIIWGSPKNPVQNDNIKGSVINKQFTFKHKGLDVIG